MRQLRSEGMPLEAIAQITGFSTGTISHFTKDVLFKIGRYRKELPVRLLKGSIIDIETTGLDFSSDEIITFGYLEGNSINVLQRAEATTAEYHQEISENLTKLPQPLYSYNAQFERSFIMNKIGIEITFVDIFTPFKMKAEATGRRYPSLDKLSPVPREFLGEKTISGGKIPMLWQSYVSTKDKRALGQIVRHNIEDLRQTLSLLSYMSHDELERELPAIS